MRLGVQFKCCSNNTDVCKICGQKPEGDYWHCNNKIFLCRPCMTDAFQTQSKYKREELNHFSVSILLILIWIISYYKHLYFREYVIVQTFISMRKLMPTFG